MCVDSIVVSVRVETPQSESTFRFCRACRILSDFLTEVEQTVRDKYEDMEALDHQRQFMMMLNSINYLRSVISEWCDQVVSLSSCFLCGQPCSAFRSCSPAGVPHPSLGTPCTSLLAVPRCPWGGDMAEFTHLTVHTHSSPPVLRANVLRPQARGGWLARRRLWRYAFAIPT